MSFLLAVVLDYGSVGPAEVIVAADGICDVAFICDRSIPYNAAHLSELRPFATVIELESPTARQIADALVALDASGVMTFTDFRIGLTAEAAELCGLRFHSVSTARLLTDKFAQRQALARAGVQSTRSSVVASEEDVASAVKATGLPAVFKPRHGACGAHTYRIDSEQACLAAIANVTASDGHFPEFVLEELLAGSPDILGPNWGDYVSVESLAVRGDMSHVCVTGKFPLVEPFRETGQFAPALLPSALAGEVRSLVSAGLRAIGLSDGATHTEVKLTLSGPRIIEINGRIGGYINEMVLRASGFDLLKWAIQVAVGYLTVPPGIDFQRIAFFQVFPVPIGRFRLAELHGVSELRRIPGVEHVAFDAKPGHILDSRLGSHEFLGRIRGSVSSYDELQAVSQAASRSVRPVYDAMPLTAVTPRRPWSPPESGPGP